MSRVKKPASRKQKAKGGSGRASRPAPSPLDPCARSPRRRPAQPAGAYAGDERKSLALLLTPFLVMTLAVGASQWIAPRDSDRRQFALLPDAMIAPEASAPPARLAAASPKAANVVERPQMARTVQVGEAVTAIAPRTTLRQAMPYRTVVASLARPTRVGKCMAPALVAAAPPRGATVAAASPAAFGRMLARAARAQTQDLVIYSDAYRQIRFPMGDVPAFYGVCTDVVVRAYRSLGIDLQVLVQKAGMGTGDPSIDHRRTKTLRRFFERFGESLPVTDFAEDYLPGDIVTYHRASGRTSQSHIAVVSDVVAPSGRPMIVHNRGWGPQLEDALFASHMTGHYRFAGDISAGREAGLTTPPRAERLAQSPAPPQRSVSTSATP